MASVGAEQFSLGRLWRDTVRALSRASACTARAARSTGKMAVVFRLLPTLLCAALAGSLVTFLARPLAAQAVASTVTVGSSPFALAVNPATGRIYVANTGSNTVSVIDGSRDTVTATVTVGSQPVALAVNPVTNQISGNSKKAGHEPVESRFTSPAQQPDCCVSC